MGSQLRVASVRPRAVGFAVLVSMLSFSAGLRAQDDARELLDAGLQSFREGDTQAAKEAFEKAFSQAPSNDVLARWVEKATVAELIRMAQRGDSELIGYAKAILEGSRTHHREMSGDAEAIAAAVDEVDQSSGEEQTKRMIVAANRFGRNIVPALIPLMGDAEIDRRRVAFSWITQYIQLDAVPPLVAAWNHPDVRVRTEVAKLLGTRSLRHAYSIGYLRLMADGDSDSEVRDAAKDSIAAILAGGAPAALASVDARRSLLYNAKELYLAPHSNPFDKSSYAAAVYELEGEEVVVHPVARFQISERMAMQNLAAALALEPNARDARALNLLNDSAQVVEYDKGVEWYSSGNDVDGISDLLAEQKSFVDGVLRMRTRMAPAAVIHRALELSLEFQRRPEVTHYVVERLRERGVHGSIPAPLVMALEDTGSRLVRVAAATTIADANPRSFDAGSQVVDILTSAVLQSGLKTVVRALGDQDNANRFGAIIRKGNMEGQFEARSVPEAIDMATRVPPDLILADESLSLALDSKGVAPVAVLVNSLRRDYRTQEIPVVVVVSPSRVEAARELHEDEERKVWVLGANVSDADFLEKVDEILDGQDAVKDRAVSLASAAASTLGKIAASGNSAFPVEEAVSRLSQSLSGRPDDVRIPVMQALGNLGASASDALSELATTFLDTDNSSEVRAGAMSAIARILASIEDQRDPLAVDGIVKEAIETGAADGDLALRRPAWMAFGASRWTDEEFLDLLAAEAGDITAGAGGDAEGGDDFDGAGFDGADSDDADADSDSDDDDGLDFGDLGDL